MNGRLYREDPTILAWDVLNEERCTGCGALVRICKIIKLSGKWRFVDHSQNMQSRLHM